MPWVCGTARCVIVVGARLLVGVPAGGAASVQCLLQPAVQQRFGLFVLFVVHRIVFGAFFPSCHQEAECAEREKTKGTSSKSLLVGSVQERPPPPH